MYAVLPRHEICWSWIGVAMISFSSLFLPDHYAFRGTEGIN